MTLALTTPVDPWHPGHKARLRRRQAMMFGTSALLHLTIFGPMILLAGQEDLRWSPPETLPIINIQLEDIITPRRDTPSPLLVSPPQPQTEPRQEPLPQPEPAPTPLPETAPPPRVTLEQVRPVEAPAPLTPSLPEVTPVSPLEEARMDQATAVDAPSALSTAVPSYRPLAEAESLEPAAPADVPLATARPLPSLTDVGTRSQAEGRVDEAAQSEAQTQALQRRLQEERERAAAAARGSATSPMPRLANPVPGALAPSPGQTSPVPGVSESWRVVPGSQAERNARALRTSPLGCRSRDRLTASEQALCDERFNADVAGRNVPRITGSGNAERDARFAREGARETYNYEARRRPLSGGSGNVGTADCPGSNLGTGCAGSLLDPTLQMDSTANIRSDKTDGPRPGGPKVPGSAGATGRPGNGRD